MTGPGLNTASEIDEAILMTSLLPAASLLVHVDDVLHQKVPLQSVHSMSIQNHLMSAGRAAETTTGRHCGAAPGRQVGIGRLQGGRASHR